MCLPEGGGWREYCYSSTARDTNRRPTECHRTTRANIRFHLYGVPQGWNPHFLRTLLYAGEGHKPFEPASGSVRPELRPDRTTIALQPNALLYLRASDRTDVGPTVVGWSAVDISTGCVQLSLQFGGTGPRRVRIQMKGEGLLNSVEPSAPRHAVTTRGFVWKTNTGQD